MSTHILNPDIQPQDFAHDFQFDPRYGTTLPDLLKVPAPTAPEDFDAFWRTQYRNARACSTEPQRLRELDGNRDWRVWEIQYQSLGGVPIGGWLMLPRDKDISSGCVVGHGYGGRDAPDMNFPLQDAAVLFPCLRGQSRSRMAGVPESGDEHVLHGIEDKNTYIHGGCTADIWCGISALQEMVPEMGDQIYYFGGSFGGGIGAMALPWDDRIRAAHLSVPSFGNHPLRLQCPCVGSGDSVQNYVKENPYIVEEVLPYFDAAIAAQRTHIPVLVANALFDPGVPPPGQFSIYNALAGPKQLFLHQAGHFEYEGMDQEHEDLQKGIHRFFNHLPGS